MPVKIALMDRFGEKFTEGDNFKFYAEGFLEGGCEVFQLDPYTIDFKNSVGKAFVLEQKHGNLKYYGQVVSMPLRNFSVIVDLSDVVNLDFAEKLNKINVLHINPPLATYASADKRTYVKNYSEFIPKTVISSDLGKLEKTLKEFRGVMVVKNPLGCCGNEIEKVDISDANYRQILEDFTKKGKVEIVAQKFMHFAYEGGKRVAVIGNINESNSYKIIHFYKRHPSEGNWKDNLSQGAMVVEAEDLRRDEKELCLRVAAKSGLYAVGLDIMDDLNKEGKRIPQLVETNAVLVCSANGKFPEKLKLVTDFILDDLLKK